MNNWTDEREAQVTEIVGSTDNLVSQETVAAVAAALEVSPRSAGSKLRKMGYDVEKVSARAKTFSEEHEAQLVSFLNKNPGKYTYAEIAANFVNGKFSPKQIQGTSFP